MENKNLPACPVETTFLIIANRWSGLIIRELLTGTKRFGELKKSLEEISQKVLTQNLRTLEDRKILTRKVFAEMPPRVEYSLTDVGKSLEPIYDSLEVWGLAYKNLHDQS